MWLHLIAAGSTGTSSGEGHWLIFGQVVTALVAVGSLIWGVRKDTRREKRQDDKEENQVSADYLKRSLEAFDELVGSLQTEVKRQTEAREAAEARVRSREQVLIREIIRLRTAMKTLITALEQNQIPVPSLGPDPDLELFVT